MMARIGVYAGSFDPVTAGHEDIIRRAAKLCDRLLVTVMYNPNKTGCFSVSAAKINHTSEFCFGKNNAIN